MSTTMLVWGIYFFGGITIALVVTWRIAIKMHEDSHWGDDEVGKVLVVLFFWPLLLVLSAAVFPFVKVAEVARRRRRAQKELDALDDELSK